MTNIKGRMKSVLIVSNCTWYLYNFRKELLNELKEKGYTLILLSPFDEYYSRISKYFDHKENLFLSRGSENPFFEIITIINLFLAYKKFKPDLVHHFTIKPCIYGGIISRFLDIKNTINHVTGIGPSFCSSRIKIKYLNKILKPFYKYAFNNKKNNIVNIFHNSSDRDTFIENRITTIVSSKIIEGSGVDVEFFTNSLINRELKINLQILFPARIIKEKGIIELISACKELWEEDFNFILNIAGDVDLQNKSHLNKKTIEFFNKNQNIRFLGKCKNMKEIYKKMDLVILPSWREGLSKSLLEAASMSMPIITTSVPGCKEIIKNNYSGIVVPVKDKNKLKKAIKNLIENPKLAKMYGENARTTVCEKFSVTKINTKIINIYDQFLKF